MLSECQMQFFGFFFIDVLTIPTLRLILLIILSLDNTAYGENLAANAGNGAYAELRHPEKIMIRWVEKEADVGWPANSHLTQVLWRATKYVGCYEHATEWRTGMCHIQVCRYARPGMSRLLTCKPHISFVYLTM